MILSIAARNLLQARRRSLFLGSAMAVVTILLSLLLGLSQGITETLTRAATTISAGHVVVGGFYKITAGRGIPRVLDRERVRRIVEEHTPNLKYLTDRQRGFGKVVGLSGSMTAGLHGIDIDEEPTFREVVRLAPESRYKAGGTDQVFGSLDRLREPNSILLFATQAERLGVGVGDLVTLSAETERGAYNTVDCTVVAVAEDMGMLSSWSTFMPKEVINSMYRTNSESTGAVMVYLKDINEAEETMAHLRDVFVKEGYQVMDHLALPFFAKFDIVGGEDWTGQKLDLTIWEDEVVFLTFIITAFDLLTFALVSVLLFIIAIGFFNSMVIAVRERRAEIGTLRAIGMSRWRVGAMFLAEAVMLAVVSTSIGLLVGAGLVIGLDFLEIPVTLEAFRSILLSDTLNLAFTTRQIKTALPMMLGVASFGALVPALMAARLKPVVAMRR